MENSVIENLERIYGENNSCLHIIPCLFERQGELHCIQCNRINLNIESKILSEMNIKYKPDKTIKICRPFPNKSYFVGALEIYQSGWLIPFSNEIQSFDLTFNWSMILNPYHVSKREYRIKHRCRIELVEYTIQGENIYSTEETISKGVPTRCFTPFGEEEIKLIKSSRVKRLWESCFKYHADGIETLLIDETVLLPKLSKRYAINCIAMKIKNPTKTNRSCRCPEKMSVVCKTQEEET